MFRSFLRRAAVAACAVAFAGLALVSGVPMNAAAAPHDPWLTIPAGDGPGRGKKIVLIAADQEYRSEETLPQFARILARRHGFDCTVLFCVDPNGGTVNPTISNIPGLDKLRDADLVVFFTRFLDLPNEQVAAILDYADSGRPMLALRTSTHTFNLTRLTYKKWSWNSKEAGFEGGFGRLVFGETWISHHGEHGIEGTRGIVAPGQDAHPILRGIVPGAIFGTSDVYGVRLPLPGDSLPLVLGEVTATLEPASASVAAKNAPMMPVAWTRTYAGPSGRPARVFTTTMGASQDFAHEGTRRMLVNAAYWAVGLESKIPPRSNVDLVGEFKPTAFRFKKNEDWKPGVKPSAH